MKALSRGVSLLRSYLIPDALTRLIAYSLRVRGSRSPEVAMRNGLIALSFAASFLAAVALAQEEHRHPPGETEELGTVHFPTSCRADVAAEFTRSVALLHSFGYEEARLAFGSVAERDPGCAMAHWGIAMTYYHPV